MTKVDPANARVKDMRIKVLSNNQAACLGAASVGCVIYRAEPGRSHSGNETSAFYTLKTIQSLARAEFLEPTTDGGYRITALGLRAYAILRCEYN